MAIKSIRKRFEERQIQAEADSLPPIEIDFLADVAEEDVYIADDGRKYYSEQWVMQLLNEFDQAMLDEVEQTDWFESFDIDEDEDSTRL
jgi:hypothetical protein